MINPPLVLTVNRSDFPISFSSKEATFTVPNSNDDGPRDRMEKLETKIDNHSNGIQKLDRSLATLETKIDHHSEGIRDVKGGLDGIEQLLEGLRAFVAKRTSASRVVTWTYLSALVPLAGVLYFFVLPHRIETVFVSDNGTLNLKLATAIDERFKPTNDKLSSLQGDMNLVKERLKDIISVLPPLLTREKIVANLTRDTSGDPSSLSETLPQARTLLNVVRRMKLPLQRRDYKSLSTRLMRQYSSADEPLKGELRSTLVEAANARSVTEAKNSSETFASRIEKAKKSDNYFQGAVDLSTRETWKDAVFENCTIRAGNPNPKTDLVGALFINCTFENGGESTATQDLLTAFLESTQPTVTVTLGEKGEVRSYSISPPKQINQTKTAR